MFAGADTPGRAHEGRPAMQLSPLRDQLFDAAARYLSFLGTFRRPFVVSISCDDEEHRLSCTHWPAAGPASSPPPVTTPPPKPPPADVNPDALWLSPLERRIVDFLATRGAEWTRGEDVAAAVGEPFRHAFKAIITNLAERKIIETANGRGCRLLRGT